jgi:hypothetical protein
MEQYRTHTTKAGFQRMINTFVGDIPDWIGKPDSVKEIFRHPDVVQVLLGDDKSCSKCGHSDLPQEEQAKLALMVMNAAYVLLEPAIQTGKMDDYSNNVQKNVLAFLMSIEPGIAWLALRNTWGCESANQGRRRVSFSSFQFASKYWIDLFRKIRMDPIWSEKETKVGQSQPY